MRKGFSAEAFKASWFGEPGSRALQKPAVPSPMVFVINSRSGEIQIHEEKGKGKICHQTMQGLLCFKEKFCSAQF